MDHSLDTHERGEHEVRIHLTVEGLRYVHKHTERAFENLDAVIALFGVPDSSSVCVDGKAD